MPIEHPNTVSAARDYAMLERNLLSHIRLAVLLSLSSSSLLLHARLPSSSNPASGQTPRTNAGLAIAIVEVTAALTAISAGVWEYYQGYKDMREMRGFLAASK
ncbi:hypothetical protein A0H81_06137 [Grifola frondosa]|uniref:DUF202 domain-containing protein n=1 Tax=Grifola frondosa TaxID=5627 RepID=A0A1C7M9M9_GRIFR|nr:hypothetical protein A0H81_06137 [Grifola frondosa]